MIKFGTLTIEWGELVEEEFYQLGKSLGKFGDSSVIHINFDGQHYLVDTGFANEALLTEENLKYNEKELESHLGWQGLKFEDIIGIFITHWHADHFGNLRLFPNAKIYCFNPQAESNYISLAKRYRFDHLPPIISLEETDSFAGCQLFPTPGHTRLHCSLLAQIHGFNIMIAGDAIVSQSYYDYDKVWPYNAGQLGESVSIQAMHKIIEVADYIIPGHGHPFQNYRKK